MKIQKFLIILVSYFLITAFSSQQINTVSKIIFPMPKNWIDKTDVDLTKGLSEKGFNDEQIKKILNNNKGTIPISIYFKYNPENHKGLIPTIQVNLRQNPTPNFEGFKKSIENSVKLMGNYFTNFKITSPLVEVNVGGKKALKFNSRFDMSNKEGVTNTVKSLTYFISVKKYFYQINFSEEVSENNDTLYKQLIEKIKFEE